MSPLFPRPYTQSQTDLYARHVKVKGVVYRPLAMAAYTIDLPMIELIAAWRRDNTSPLLARIAREIRERSDTLLTTV